jgi:hypothetical protein
MGTRSITRVEVEGETLIAVYRQFEGYISGHGKDLADFLENRRIVNGYNPDTEKEVFNGPGCLAANLVSFLKREEFGKAGNIYIHPIDAEDEEYSYNINIKKRNVGRWAIEYEAMPYVTVRAYGKELFSGTSEEYLNYVTEEIGK